MIQIAIAVKHLLACGATPAQVCAAVAEMEMAVQPVRSTAAIRQERYRNKASQSVTKRNEVTVKEIPPTPPKEITTNNLKVISSYPPIVPPSSKPLAESGEEFWRVYPARAGNRDKGAAMKAFRAALNRASAAEIIDGARRYAAFVTSTGKLNTELVRQARTWLNANGWEETYDAPNNHRPNTFAAGFAILDDSIAQREREIDALEALEAKGAKVAAMLS